MIALMGGNRDKPTLTDRYLLLQEIGRGGMGTVHRVRDRTLERESALKLLHRRLREDQRHLERFFEEARITGQLDHPNIVPVYELGEDGGGGVFFSMKLVQGDTLETLIEREGPHRLEPRRLAELLRIFLKVCEAVAFAHSRGVVHRDLKPSNVMVGEFGQVYLMDWGAACRLGEDEPGPPATPSADSEKDPGPSGSGVFQKGTQSVVGTAAYMSPEQARGRLDLVDERSDVFLLGATLYHILTGRPPYLAASRLQQLVQALECDFKPPGEVVGGDLVPIPLLKIVARAMAADHEQRYPSVVELQKDVELFLHGSWYQPTETHPAGSRIVVEGEEGDAAFVIVEGRCVVTTESGGTRKVLRELGPGDVFGETAVFSATPRTASVEAVDDVVVVVVTRETLTAGLGLSSWLGIFIKALAERFADVDQRLREREAADAPPRES